MGAILHVLLALLLPPLEVFLHKGLGGAFLLNLLLTIFGWIPGQIHAIYLLVED